MWVLDLIRRVRGGSRKDALHWLAQRLGILLDSAPLSRGDRRRYTQARQGAPELSLVAEPWWTERREALDRAPLAGGARLFAETSYPDERRFVMILLVKV